jgi:hypothetical protein
MDLERLRSELEAGKSLVVAKERPGAPPVVLMAAPRSAMLGDLEREVATIDALPTEPRYFDVPDNIRPHEIRAIVRGIWFPNVRGCYDTLRKTHPEAEGRIVASFEIGGDGNVGRVDVTTEDAALDVGSFSSCLEESAGELAFPAVGDTTTVRYPFVFTTD